MYKILGISFFIVGLCSFSFGAENYTTALTTASKLCTSCHGTPFYQVTQIDNDDWKFYFDTPGKLEKIHKNEPKALKVLKAPLFKKHKEDLLKFFIANSKYSGEVNRCDTNFCGTNH